MVLPEKTKDEERAEWAYKNNFLVHTICKVMFKGLCFGADLPVGWNKKKGIKVMSIGQSHIDAAWLWRKEDTRTKKINCTFDRALMHMDMYKDKPFTYSQNQVIYYQWIKDSYPRLWKGINEKMKEGRWEAVDGAWVESDVNVPSAESLIRQRLTGQHFYMENFGFMSDIAWLDDVFGFTAQLPQILAKCNCRYFLTNKFCYHDTNKWPYHTLIWRGMDGKSDLLLSWNQHKNSWWKYMKGWKERSRMVKEGEELVLNYMSDFEKAEEKFSDEYFLYTPNVFGHGDGGHGPKPLEIIQQLCWNDSKLVKMGTMRDFFNILEPYWERFPIWKDELYLENHRGTLTSIHMIKENNKTSEVLLHALEHLNILNVLNGGKNYQPEIFELWKPMLFCQFHDVLPGSSIPEVYRDCARDYIELFDKIYEMKSEIMDNLFGSNNDANNTKSSQEFSYEVINDQSWPRDGIISIPLSEIIEDFEKFSSAEGINVVVKGIKTDLAEYPCQIMKFPYYDANRELSCGRVKVTGTDYQCNFSGLEELEAYNYPELKDQYLWIEIPENKKIEAFGSLSLKISVTTSSEKGADRNNLTEKITISKTSEPILLSNSRINLKINPTTGKISETKIDDSNNIMTEIGPVLYQDNKTKFDAWNIDKNYLSNPVNLPEIDYYEFESTGPLVNSVLLKTKKSEAGTTYYYRIFIIEGMPLIHFDITVDWQEDHKLLKLRAQPVFNGEELRSGIQYGSIKRVTVPKNRFNNYKVKYEYPNQQWSSVNGEIDGKNYEVILLNRNKYGIFSQGTKMELSLLKAAYFNKWTDAATLDDDDPRPKIIDLGFSRQSAAIKIQIKNQPEEYDWQSGFDFNFPLITLKSSIVDEESPKNIKHPFATSDIPKNIILGSVKFAEKVPEGLNSNPEWFLEKDNSGYDSDSKWIMLRLAEYYGNQIQFDINLNKSFTIEDCVETDLLERKWNKISKEKDRKSYPTINKESNSISIDIEPFEIKTVAVKCKIN